MGVKCRLKMGQYVWVRAWKITYTCWVVPGVVPLWDTPRWKYVQILSQTCSVCSEPMVLSRMRTKVTASVHHGCRHMTWQCPHCDEDIENVIRTGERRFHCEACNQVVKFDDVEPALDNQDVGYIDRRKEGNTGKKEEGGGGGPPQGGGGGPPQQPPPQQQQQPPQQPEREPDHEVNERELIYEHGSRGLAKIKEERLNDWLDVTDGVGNKTKNRIAMLFGRNDRYQRDPNALYEMLNDQLKASPAYVNSIVQDVFAPEREHEDLLRDEGYVPWYDRPDGARMQPQQQINRQQQMRGGGQQGGGGYNQQQGPSQQYNQQAQGISREEAMHMMRQAQEAHDEEEDEKGQSNGMRMARDKAVMKAADNFGGFFGTMQKVAEEALVEYARKNPEWLVENSDIFMKFFGGRGGPKESEQSPEDAKIDDAISDIQGGMGGMNQQMGGGMQQQQPPYQQQQSPAPQAQFQPSPETMGMMGNGSSQQQQSQPEPEPSPEPEPQPQQQESSDGPPNHPTGDTTNAVEAEPEPEPEPEDENADEGFDELFGDIAE